MLAFPAISSAGPNPATAPATSPATRESELTVAVLDFECKAPGNPDLGKEATDQVIAALIGEPGITLIDRSSMDRVLKEHELNLTGVVDASKSIEIGKLVGARIIITGRVFEAGKGVMITAKIIGTETSLFEMALVGGKPDADVSELSVSLAHQITAKLHEKGSRIVAVPGIGTDPLPALKARLAGKKLPKLSLSITEHSVTGVSADPAVETEVRKVLIEAGFTILDRKPGDPPAHGADAVLSGEAISEPAAHIGNLISASARAELKLVESRDGTVVFSDRVTARGVDLSETIAAKTALQRAGHALALKLVKSIADRSDAGGAHQHGHAGPATKSTE